MPFSKKTNLKSNLKRGRLLTMDFRVLFACETYGCEKGFGSLECNVQAIILSILGCFFLQ